MIDWPPAVAVKGQQQRRMVPVAGLPSPAWNRAIEKVAVAFLKNGWGKRREATS